MSQIVVYTIRLNVSFHMYIENKVTGFPYVALKLLLVLCGIWSLDFFHSVIPPFCVSSNIKGVHALALKYLVAFYSFYRYFVYFRRRWDSKASIINTFTTFLLLSFSKIFFVSFTLVHSISIYHNHHRNTQMCVFYYDPNSRMLYTRVFHTFNCIK